MTEQRSNPGSLMPGPVVGTALVPSAAGRKQSEDENAGKELENSV